MEPDKTLAGKAAITAAVLSVAKQVPALGGLIDGIEAFNASMESQQRDLFIHALNDRMSALERATRDEWYRSEQGRTVCRKILATALNGEYSDKTEYLANAFLNASKVGDEAALLKFVEILRHISKPALIVLAAQEQLIEASGPMGSSQPHIKDIVQLTALPARVVEACIRELYSLGVFSSVLRMEADGTISTYLSEGTPAFTPFSKMFLDFVRKPEIVTN